MSSPKVRRFLTAIVLLLALAVVVPSPVQAAERSSASAEASLWSAAWQWLTGFWDGGALAGGFGLLAADSTAPTSSSSTPGGGAAASGATVCGGDQGVCIDPNG